MKSGFLIMGVILVAVGVMFYVLIANTTRATHMHFSTRGGVLKGIVHYSAQPPELASSHRCDGKFADMADHLYPVHVQRWQDKFAGD